MLRRSQIRYAPYQKENTFHIVNKVSQILTFTLKIVNIKLCIHFSSSAFPELSPPRVSASHRYWPTIHPTCHHQSNIRPHSGQHTCLTTTPPPASPIPSQHDAPQTP